MKDRLFRRAGESLCRRGRLCLLLTALFLAAVAFRQDVKLRLGQVAFYGYAGLDLAKIRAALPVREGEEISHQSWNKIKDRLIQAVRQVTGNAPTDVATICCDERGGLLLYIGLPGRSNHTLPYNPAPNGSARLPAEAMRLNTQLDAAIQEAVLKGKAVEDDSHGYALLSYPPARAKQLEVRKYALRHEPLLRKALALSSDAEHRQAAATFLGYARQSKEQIAALVRASHDADDDTRNAAVRALGVLARSNPKTARQIPVSGFLDMLNSGIWTDRNKASFLLMTLSANRDPKLLAQLRSRALDSLVEMAYWDAGHAYAARMILGRIAGIPEKRLEQMVASGQVDDIVNAVHGSR